MTRKSSYNRQHSALRERMKTLLPATFLQKFLASISIVSGFLLLISSLSVYVNPNDCPYVCLLGLAFPFFLVGTLLSAFLTLLFTPRQVWIPIIALLICIVPIRTYFPINFKSSVPPKAIKLVSWNVCAFWGNDITRIVNGKEINPTSVYLKKQNPDIICLQEAYGDNKFLNKFVFPTLSFLKYNDYQNFNSNTIRIFSKYPIVKSQKLCQNKNNGSAAYWLLLAPNDTLIVVNNHLMSMGLSADDRGNFKSSVEGFQNGIHKSIFLRLCRKISNATAIRAKMADKIAEFIAKHKQQKLIVCGDFNDTPISYVRQTIGKGLTDAFRSKGNGLGRSFNRDAIVVRIDHIFCSDKIAPYYCYFGKDADTSDHYPIIFQFGFQK